MKAHSNTFSRRDLLLGAVAAGAWPNVSPARAQASLKLNVGFTAINEYTGLFVAKEQGFFAKRGLEVELTLIANNATVPAALASNSIQIGTPSVTTILQAVDGGIPLQLVCGAGVLSVSKPSVGLVAKTGSNIAKASDFAGKRVGVPGLNALFHIIARQWMIKGGQDPKTVHFVEVPFAQMFDTLRGGQVDALVTAEPARSRIINGGVGFVVGNILEAIMDNALSGNYTATSSFISANRQPLASFRAALDEAHAFAASQQEATLNDVGKYLKLPLETLRSLPSPILRTQIDRAQVEFWVKVAIDQGMLRSPLSVDQLMGGLA